MNIKFAEKIKDVVGFSPERQKVVEERMNRRTAGLDLGPRAYKRTNQSEARWSKRRRKANRLSHQKKATARYRRKQWTEEQQRQNLIGLARVWFNADLIGTPIWRNVRHEVQRVARARAEQEEISYEKAFEQVEAALHEVHEAGKK